jgi:L-ascorbate metabolism protein UlaG (beta-lactamase superfamily)
MDVLWIGHAGILIRSSKDFLTIDPFLKGRFKWHNIMNFYQGDSPWIGSPEKFLESYGKQISSILITHAHKDHFDLQFLSAMNEISQNVKIFGPKTVIRRIKNYSFDFELIETRKYQSYTIFGYKEKRIQINILPVHRFQSNQKVGYLIEELIDDKHIGLFFPGDCHYLGKWNPYFTRMTHLITWIHPKWLNVLPEFIKNTNIKKIWWVHWENFKPGNFHCSQDINQLVKKFSIPNVKGEILPYDGFISII